MEVKKIRKENINNTNYIISHLDFSSAKENLFNFLEENNINYPIKLIYISNFKKINKSAFNIFFKNNLITEIEIFTTNFKHFKLKNKEKFKNKTENKPKDKSTNKPHLFFLIEINSNCKMINGKFINNKIFKIIKKAKKKNINIGFKKINKKSETTCFFANIKTAFTDLDEDISNILLANLHNTLTETYTFIYDKVCDKLDQNFMVNNYCNFNDDKCIANRDSDNIEKDNGCCHSFIRNKNIKAHKSTEELTLCKYLGDNKECQIKCISCKFFVCQYLKDRGVYLDILDNFLLRAIFNRKQLDVIHINFFKTEEETINKLIKVKKNHMPYKLFVLFKGQLIDNYWSKTEIKK